MSGEEAIIDNNNGHLIISISSHKEGWEELVSQRYFKERSNIVTEVTDLGSPWVSAY